MAGEFAYHCCHSHLVDDNFAAAKAVYLVGKQLYVQVAEEVEKS